MLRARVHPRRTVPEGQLEVGICDVQIIGHAQLKKELSVGITLANTMSSQDALPCRPVTTNPGIKIAEDDELVCIGSSINGSSEFRIEFLLIFIRVLSSDDR